MVENELTTWDSPIGGAYLIWRFVKGYTAVKSTGPSAVLVFPALAIVLNQNFASSIDSEGSLADFSFSFHDSTGKNAKSLVGLREQIDVMRGWILDSINFAVVTRLVELDVTSGELKPVLADECEKSAMFARKFKDTEGLQAEFLGAAFARTRDSNIGYYLGVKF